MHTWIITEWLKKKKKNYGLFDKSSVGENIPHTCMYILRACNAASSYSTYTLNTIHLECIIIDLKSLIIFKFNLIKANQFQIYSRQLN